MARKLRRISKILAIDFETANRTRASACSLGLCVIDFSSGVVTEKKQFLINPNVEFEFFNTLIHGINAYTVKDSPLFPAVVPEITSRIDENTIVVAHNAAFDMSVLRHCCAAYHLPVPEMNYFCTYVLSKALLPGLPSYTLPSVSEKCGCGGFSHHLADEDAEACAKIFLCLLHAVEAETIWQLSRRSGIQFGHLWSDGDYVSCHKTRERQIDLTEEDFPEAPLSRPTVTPSEDSPFSGKVVVFTGALKGMTRAEAEAIVQAAGGTPGANVTVKTNFVVCGYQDPAALRGHEKSAKLAKAEKYAANGQDIQIIQEDDFRKMIF